MKQSLLFLFCYIIALTAFAQNSKFTLEAAYPLPVDDNFIGRNYKGIIDVGAKYRFSELPPFNLGFGLNGSILNNKNALLATTDVFLDITVTTFIIQPKVFAELDLESVPKFHPSVGLGYTFMIFNASGTDQAFGPSDTTDAQSGLNINFGVAYDISDRFFAQVQYDFIKLNVDGGVQDIKFNTNVNIIKFGFGYRL